MKVKVQLFKSADGWRVRIRAHNGKIIMSSEAYSRPAKAVQTAKGVAEALGLEPPTIPAALQ